MSSTTSTSTPFPTDEEAHAAGAVLMSWARSYGFVGTIHDAIDMLCRSARVLAPAVAESALETGNTDVRPEVVRGGRKADAWDMVALAHALNALSVD